MQYLHIAHAPAIMFDYWLHDMSLMSFVENIMSTMCRITIMFNSAIALSFWSIDWLRVRSCVARCAHHLRMLHAKFVNANFNRRLNNQIISSIWARRTECEYDFHNFCSCYHSLSFQMDFLQDFLSILIACKYSSVFYRDKSTVLFYHFFIDFNIFCAIWNARWNEIHFDELSF